MHALCGRASESGEWHQRRVIGSDCDGATRVLEALARIGYRALGHLHIALGLLGGFGGDATARHVCLEE